MEDEVANSQSYGPFQLLKKPSKSVTLFLSTKGSEVTAKLEVKLINAKSLLTLLTLLTLLYY